MHDRSRKEILIMSVENFRTGIALVPVSADPTDPVEGQLQYSDGTARPEGLHVFTNTVWVQIGSASSVLNSDTFEATLNEVSAPLGTDPVIQQAPQGTRVLSITAAINADGNQSPSRPGGSFFDSGRRLDAVLDDSGGFTRFVTNYIRLPLASNNIGQQITVNYDIPEVGLGEIQPAVHVVTTDTSVPGVSRGNVLRRPSKAGEKSDSITYISDGTNWLLFSDDRAEVTVTRVLTSNITVATSSISELVVGGLIPGRTYRVFVNAVIATSSNRSATFSVIHNSVNIARVLGGTPSESTNDAIASFGSVQFEAQSTSVQFSFTPHDTSVSLLGGSSATLRQTYIKVTELIRQDVVAPNDSSFIVF